MPYGKRPPDFGVEADGRGFEALAELVVAAVGATGGPPRVLEADP